MKIISEYTIDNPNNNLFDVIIIVSDTDKIYVIYGENMLLDTENHYMLAGTHNPIVFGLDTTGKFFKVDHSTCDSFTRLYQLNKINKIEPTFDSINWFRAAAEIIHPFKSYDTIHNIASNIVNAGGFNDGWKDLYINSLTNIYLQ